MQITTLSIQKLKRRITSSTKSPQVSQPIRRVPVWRQAEIQSKTCAYYRNRGAFRPNTTEHVHSNYNGTGFAVLCHSYVANNRDMKRLRACFRRIALIHAFAILQTLLKLLGVLGVLTVKVRLTTCRTTNLVQRTS